MGVAEDVACLLVEHQENLGLSDIVLARYIDWLEEMSAVEDEYVDLSFMDEDDEYPICRGQQWEDRQYDGSETEEESDS